MLEIRKLLVPAVFLVFCVLVFSGIVAAASPDVVFVKTTGNDANSGTNASPKLTILNATDAVASGGIVFIGKGIYKGNGNRNININKDLIIVGENQQNTIIDAQGLSRIFKINNTNVTLMNLTLKNGKTSGESGGAIHIVNGSYVTVVNSTFTNNKGEFGGAIYNYGTLNVASSTFTNNIGISGGAIHSDIKSNMNIISSTFTGNTATSFGGGAIDCSSNMNVFNSTFKNNYARISGGAIDSEGNVNVIGSTFTNNNVTHSGGAIFNANNLNVTDSTFTGNTAYGSDYSYGGGAIRSTVNMIVIGSKFIENRATNGGAIYSSSIATVNFNRIIGNTASGDGDAIYHSDIVEGYVDAINNWWGSNYDPSSKVYGNVIVDPWIKAPTVTSTDPKNNAVNVPANKVIKVTFNKNIKMGTGWIELKRGTTIVPIVDPKISGNVLTIKPSSNLSEGKYTVAVHTGAVTDSAGIFVALFSTKFTVGASSKVMVSQVLVASSSVKSYYEKNKKLPSTVTINGSNVSMPKFLYLLSQTTIQINSGKTASITIKNVNAPPKESGKIKSGKIVKKDFVNIAKNVVNFINTKGRVPNYVSTKLGNMKYTKVICMFSNVLSFYKTNKRLPNYVSMNK